jgi:predicted metal-dependent HD superfamily phosphohydrolase
MAASQAEAAVRVNSLTWSRHWRDVGNARPSEGLYQQLIGNWCQPQRHYHSLQHLHECLTHFETWRDQVEHPGEVALALWFHDAIYDVRRKDNEARSAEWARLSVLQAGLPSAVSERIAALVLATRHLDLSPEPHAQLVVDIDLAILGAPESRFDEFDQQVRAEYAHVPDDEYRPARQRVLAAFLHRPRIYSTPRLHTALEERARANLQRALARLQQP